MDMNNILNTLLIFSFGYSIVYGIIVMAKNKKTKLIFKVTLLAMLAFFTSRLFFIVFNLADGDETNFSVGVLGQVAGYLFLVLANKTYLPFELKKQRFCCKALLIILFPIIVYSYCILTSYALSEIVCSVLYLSSTCLALFFSFNNLLLAKSDENYKPLKLFYICVVTITFTSTLENIIAFISNETLRIIVSVTLTAICFANSICILPLLNKEVKKYDC